MSGKGMRHKATSADVARLAGVSRATVSRCFSEADTVRKDTRDRVMQAARDLGYEPNQLARMLQTRTSDMVAVLTADFANPFQPALLEALSGGLAGMGKMPLLLKAELTPDAADELVQVALAYRVAAVVVTVLPVSDLAIRRCVEAETPLILLNRVAEDSQAISVCGDLQAGARRAADVLADGGHRRISMITGRARHWTTRMRRGGFSHRLDEHGIDLLAQTSGDYTYSGGFEAALQIMEAFPQTDAIYACNDAMACGAMDALRSRLGRRVPDDVAVLGFDNVPVAGWAGYGLSTIHQPINRLIGKVCELLETPDRGLSQAGTVMLEGCRFVQRGSTRPVPLQPGDIDGAAVPKKGTDI